MIVTERDAGPDDADLLAAFWRERFSETFGATYDPADLAAYLAATYSPAQQWAELLNPALATRLAIGADGGLLGALLMGPLALPVSAPPGALELKRLYVVEAAKGAGIAARLMDWALTHAKACAARAIYLGVWRHNERAQRFYSRYGFVKIGEYQFPVGKTIDEEDILRLDLPLY